MQPSLDYRGLRRWSVWVWLIAVLLVSSYLAAIPMLILLAYALGISAAATSLVGWAAVGAIVIIPLWGVLGGLWGIVSSKRTAVRVFNAVELPHDHALTRVTAHMADRLNLPPPQVYVYPDDDINAWATGMSRSNAAIAVSRGALKRLSKDHLYAVIGHELGHIAAADIGRMSFALSFQRSSVAYFLFRGLQHAAGHTMGFVGQLGILGMSRRREYWADAIGAILTSPETMQGALRAVVQDGKQPARKRKYYKQLMFSWPGAVWLSSHPTLKQRLAALNEGQVYALALRKMDGGSSRPAKTHQRRAREASTVWQKVEAWFDNPWVEGTAAVVALAAVFGIGWHVIHLEQAPSPVLVQQQPVNEQVTTSEVAPSTAPVPRVAGWSAETPPDASLPSKPAAEPSRQPKMAALPVYPKEPRYEPDEASGDGELTPYQSLVENGTICIYQAKPSEEFASEHLEDAGPDKSDLMVYFLPRAQQFAEISIGVAGAAVTSCWKKHGAVQREPDMMKRVRQTYDVWTLIDPASGATAECGIWPAARQLKNGKAGIAAYCR